MNTYISILRGINVSGQKKILMADLKALYEELGFRDVVTYIQSGNVIFKTHFDASAGELAEIIDNGISGRYDFMVPVIVRTLAELKKAAELNPFLKEDNIDLEKLHVTFLANKPSENFLRNIKSYNYPPDRFSIIGREVYLHCPNKYGETKFSNKFFESKLKVIATTRNWNTVTKLIELAEG